MSIKYEIANLKQIILNQKQICDLELLLNQAFAPLKGYMKEFEYESVLVNTRLPNGSLWPIPIYLDIPQNVEVGIGEKIVLVDPYLKPLATLDVESIYTPPKEYEAECVFGTQNKEHAGVRMLFEKTNPKYIGGTIAKINDIHHYDFKDLRLNPEQTREFFNKHNWG